MAPELSGEIFLFCLHLLHLLHLLHRLKAELALGKWVQF